MSQENRYDRQSRLPEIGAEGQARIAAAHVAVVGVGALGSVAADLLARAGVGTLSLIDRDVVELSNLQRQTLYDESDAEAALPKSEAAARRLTAVNAGIEIRAFPEDLTASNAVRLLDGASLLLDGTDNFSTRYLLNDFGRKHEVPYVYAGVVGTYGMVGTILTNGPCLRCTYSEPPPPEASPSCRTAGVLGPAVAVIAGFAAAEALKVLAGHSAAVLPGYRYVDLWSGESRQMKARQDESCPVCARNEYEWLEGGRDQRQAEALCGGNAVQVPASESAPDLALLHQKLAGAVDSLQLRQGYLRFAADGLDLLVFADGRALVRGTEDAGRAKAVLARTVGA